MSEMLALSHVNFNHPCSISSGVLVISILCWAYVLLVCRVCVFFIGLFVLSNSPFDTCCFLFIALCGFIARRCVVVQKLRYISSIPRSIYIVYTQYRLWTEIISALYRIHNCHMNCLWLFWSIENFMFYYCICITQLGTPHANGVCSNITAFDFQIPMVWIWYVTYTVHTVLHREHNDGASRFVELFALVFPFPNQSNLFGGFQVSRYTHLCFT